MTFNEPSDLNNMLNATWIEWKFPQRIVEQVLAAS